MVYWTKTNAARLVKSFFASIKKGLELQHGVKQVFITGGTPYFHEDLESVFNVVAHIRDHPLLSNICGVTRSDLLEVMALACKDEEQCLRDIKDLRYCILDRVYIDLEAEPIFKTDEALDYLEVMPYQPNMLCLCLAMNANFTI